MGWLLSLAALSGEQRSETHLVSGTRMMEHTHAEQCLSAPSGAQPSSGKAVQFRTHRGSHQAFQLKQICSCDGPTTTALKLAILCYALCTTTLCTAILQGNSTRAHKGTCSSLAACSHFYGNRSGGGRVRQACLALPPGRAL